ncbi:MAG: CMP-N,N'-diacetyllegionaminic acid synthase [Parasphingorhabdus sp.]
MRRVGLIPARGGSKGIPSKNLVELDGRPLIAHTICCALDSKVLDSIIVSTDSLEIAEVAQNYGADVPFLRPQNISQDNSNAVEVIDHCLRFLSNSDYFPDTLVYLQPTSPLRISNDIIGAIARFDQERADTLVSVQTVPHQFNPESIMQMDDTNRLMSNSGGNESLDRHFKPSYVARNGPAILVLNVTKFLQEKAFYAGNMHVVGYPMPKERSIDIDEPWDLRLAQAVLNLDKL